MFGRQKIRITVSVMACVMTVTIFTLRQRVQLSNLRDAKIILNVQPTKSSPERMSAIPSHIQVKTIVENKTKAEIPTHVLVKTTEKSKIQDSHRNNWIILLTVNSGFLDFFQNWLWYFQRHHLHVPVIVTAEDNSCFQKLKSLNSGLFAIERSSRNNTDQTLNWNTRAFKQFTAARPSHILKYLLRGKSVLYCDADSVWLQNPFPYFDGNYDVWVQRDGNELCTGFLAFRNNAKTVKLVTGWKEYLDKRPSTRDQAAFNKQNRTGLQFKSLDSKFFPAGYLYFTKFNATQRSKVVVVHNNCIVGHERKLKRFKEFKLWKIPDEYDYSESESD